MNLRSTPRTSLPHCFATAACLVLGLVAATSLAASEVKSGHLTGAYSNKPRLSRLPASTLLELRLSLPLQQASLDVFLEELNTLGNPNYHQFVTPAEFTERFGPTEADVATVVAFAQSHGMTVTEVPADRKYVKVQTTAANAEQVFGMELGLYEHPLEAGRTFFAPDREVTEVEGLSLPLVSITGLHNATTIYHHMSKIQPVAQTVTSDAGTGPSGLYQGNDFRNAYAPGMALTGAGQTIGIFAFGNTFFASDITSYCSAAGLSTPSITTVLLDGVGSVPASGSDVGEQELDIDMSHAMAPGANIYFYAGNSGDDILSRMASDNIAKQLTCSWGWGPASGNESTYFQQMLAQGQNFFSASGDGGSYTGGQTMNVPTGNPYQTAVGGTSLTMNGNGASWASEVAWAGSGGGVSTFPIPSYQVGVSMASNGGSTTYRNIPDVASVASNIFLICNQGQEVGVGGTSAATPLWAGFCALMNQQAAANGQTSIGSFNAQAYSLGQGAGYGAAFHDITSGNDGAYTAVTGYDLVTGWGSPNGQGTVNAFAPVPVPITMLSLSSFFNRSNGVVADGSTFTVGLDGGGYAYSSKFLGTSLTYQAVPFILGPPNGADAVAASGQTLLLPHNPFSSLHLLAAGVQGNKPSQVFKVTYTDGSTASFTQSVSDWCTPQNYAGEGTAVAMTYRDYSNGGRQTINCNLYGYALSLTKAKTVSSIVLPNTSGLMILAMTLVP